jgi:hypothetical protein
MKRLLVLSVALSLFVSSTGCLEEVAETDTAATDVAPEVATGSSNILKDVDSLRCEPPTEFAGEVFDVEAFDDPNCDEPGPVEEEEEASAGAILTLLAFDSARFHAVLATTYPGYDVAKGEAFRLQLTAPDGVDNYLELAMRTRLGTAYPSWVDTLTPTSDASQVLEKVGHLLEKRLNRGVDAPGDEGAIFAIAIGLELQGYESALASQVLALKTFNDVYSETAVTSDLFGWVRRAWRWTTARLRDGWRFVRRQIGRIDWACVGHTLGVSAACAGCVASVALAPESGGTTLTAAQALCGAGCVAGVIRIVDAGLCQ